MLANPKKLHKRLKWLWDNRTSGPGEEAVGQRWRYVPQSFSSRGPGWGVFDRLEERFLKDAEVVGLSMDQLRDATHLS